MPRKLQFGPLRIACAVLRFSKARSLRFTLLIFTCGCFVSTARTDYLETIGLRAMRRERPLVTGAGVPVAQPEGRETTNTGASARWEINPAYNPAAAFSWTSALGTTTNFPNAVGTESGHANSVATFFFGPGTGVSPGVPRVDSYDADYFIESKVALLSPIPGRVVNQSFILDGVETVDDIYDAYAAQYNVLFVSGMNNIPDTPHSPGTCANGIGVGIISTTGQSSVGPTSDGRAKPDLVAPHPCCSSISTPLVAGGAALLLQAAAENDGGANTASQATNASVIKALLINGAVKSTNWTNGFSRPLDARYGAGVLNIYNSDLQLRGGRRTALATNSVLANSPHPPTSATNNVASLRGWDLSSIQSGVGSDRVAHYYFNLPTNAGAFSATATLVWKVVPPLLANLDLFLYETANNTLVSCSTSSVDNVEHIFVPKLPAGRYDLQVLKRSSIPPGSESYALAFDFSSDRLSIARHDTDVNVSWAASPAGFTLQAAASLDVPIAWQDVSTNSVLSNALNTAAFPASSSRQFFRLFRP